MLFGSKDGTPITLNILGSKNPIHLNAIARSVEYYPLLLRTELSKKQSLDRFLKL
jgi:hypothetical protein